jgi:hypothetical protein
MATFVSPRRQGRPKVSLMMTAMRLRVHLRSAAASFLADRSGFRGSSVTTSSPGTFEWSTPALAQTKPWRVSAIST